MRICVYIFRYRGIIRPENIFVRMGSIARSERSGSIRQLVSQVIPHPHYSLYGYVNDIALLHLADPYLFNDLIQPICLPASSTVDLKQFKVCFNTGYGQTTSLIC